MDELFGIQINNLTLVLLVIFGLCAVVLTVSALRNRVMLKIAIRNIPRRPAQTVLVLLGLMLAAMLFSASFTTGETMSYSIRNLSVRQLGEVDIIVQSQTLQGEGQPAYFDYAYLAKVEQALAGEPTVAGIVPCIRENVPVLASENNLNEPQVELLGLGDGWTQSFGSLVGTEGAELSLDELGEGRVYLSAKAAQKLDVETGDAIAIFLSSQPTTLRIAGIYEKGAPGGDLSMVLPLSHAQALTGRAGSINSIAITNQGDALDGVQYSDSTIEKLQPALEGTDLEAKPVKKTALEEAETTGDSMMSMFVMLAQFSIMAGILLIFLIFVMMAAERKSELGTLRAVGTQRDQIVRLFTFEGIFYALIASAIGSPLGLGVGWLMVKGVSAAFDSFDLQIIPHFNPIHLVIAYVMGVILTLAVVAFSAWRVSKLNIIRAIRDLPEPKRASRPSLKGIVFAVALVAFGGMLVYSGFQADQLANCMAGGSLGMVGLGLLARRIGLAERAAFTLTGGGLLAWWLVPLPFGADMSQGMEMFFMSGIMMVLGVALVAIYNMDLLVNALTFFFGRIRGLRAVTRTSIAYPTSNRFRTGAALAMFCLVIFTLVVMNIIYTSMIGSFGDARSMSGGFDIRSTVSYANPIPDLSTTLGDVDGINPDDFEAVAGISSAMLKMRQSGTDQDWEDVYIQGADAAYTGISSYKFAMMADGYDSPRDVWQALANEPGLAVVSTWLIPTKMNYDMGPSNSGLQLEGFYREDEALPEVYIEARSAIDSGDQRLRVIGVLEDVASFYVPFMMTSQDTLNALVGQSVPTTAYLIRVKPGVDASVLANGLEAAFVQHGMDSVVLQEERQEAFKANDMITNLIQGFMGLGLVVGIAALGVIAARSVVERRQQIGVLRALGFQKGAVQFGFLLESSFIALLGIGLGVLLGYALSFQLTDNMADQIEGLTCQIPWIRIIAIAGIAYAASLITTVLPARKAASIYPAQALRYE